MHMLKQEGRLAAETACPWSSAPALLPPILLVLVLVCVQAGAGVNLDPHPGRQLFLRGRMQAVAASYNGEFYEWINVATHASVGQNPKNRGLEDGTFLALFYWLDATEFMGRRIKLSATIKGRGIDERQGAWAGLFMRLDAADGSVMAFDNMSTRRYLNSLEDMGPPTFARVVLEVPAGPDPRADVCVDPASVPSRIAAGFFVVGNITRFIANNVVVKGVGAEVAVTQGPRPFWHNPCLDNLGEGYLKPQDEFWDRRIKDDADL